MRGNQPVSNEIPAITDELGRYWEQPDLRGVLIDDTHCILTRKQFDSLQEYSASQPSGVYSGKAWKRHNGAFDEQFKQAGGRPEWLLAWYGDCSDPEKCSVNFRKILIDDSEALND
jgi:hypothetical protein